MEPERFRELLDAYGGEEQRWPAEHRQAMQAFYSGDSGARADVQRARELDLLLDSYRVNAPDLTQRIIDRVAPTGLGRFFAWLQPTVPAQWWRPATAFALPLLLGVALGLSDGYDGVSSAAIDWELQEQALLRVANEEAWYE